MDKKWFLENDIYTKLFQAIDTVRDGQGWEVFEGLQKGECTVKIVHDGMAIHFESTKRKKVKTIDEMIPKTWKPAAPEENKSEEETVTEPTKTPEPEEEETTESQKEEPEAKKRSKKKT